VTGDSVTSNDGAGIAPVAVGAAAGDGDGELESSGDEDRLRGGTTVGAGSSGVGDGG
jgi:hypothetical protein